MATDLFAISCVLLSIAIIAGGAIVAYSLQKRSYFFSAYGVCQTLLVAPIVVLFVPEQVPTAFIVGYFLWGLFLVILLFGIVTWGDKYLAILGIGGLVSFAAHLFLLQAVAYA